MSDPTVPPPAEPAAPPPEPSPASRTWRVLGGALLVLIGIAWLLEAMDVLEVPWGLLLPAGLIAIGAVLVANARTGASHGGLIALGVVLTVLLLLGSLISFPFAGGVGDRTERPTTAALADERFELGVGKLTVDLTEVPLPAGAGSMVIDARVGIGQLIVEVPDGVPVRVEARVGLGNARAFDLEEGVFDVDLVSEPQGAAPVLDLRLSVGIGEVTVGRG